MKFLNLAYVSKVNIASLNGAEGAGGNLVPIKKITDNDGNEYAYLSGQALRRYLKETLRQLGEKITGVNEKGNPDFAELNAKIYDKSRKKFADKKLMYKTFCDLDLFGYMLPEGGRRWSPVKVSPMLSLYPYKGEYDYLTRKKQVKEEKKHGDIVQIEIDTMNFMRGNIVIDCDKVGKEIDEYTYQERPMLEEEEIRKRIKVLLDALKFLNGGAKQARNLEDIAPKFIVAVVQNTGNPFLLNKVKIAKESNIDAGLILDALEENKAVVEKVYVGISKGIFDNYDEALKAFKEKEYKVGTVSEALDWLKEEV